MTVHIISEDQVFITIIHRLLINRFGKVKYTKSRSFNEVKLMSENSVYDVILLDKFIAGTAPFELLSFLRNKKNILTPIFYFTINELDEVRALEVGANKVIIKPFVPSDLMDEVQLLNSNA
ncbi:response regulator [Carboxylicivirga sp. M1479]|uniref:response regulator n=1 Tax=Carboxylicivirga sp. M1479 TaxID=2594476 RepID=UPI0011786AE1|nr:response regulator [Carboxylicivirga sp. M1479]TRX62376.1 response regulator [Carboxylicivirga sp. M1479]